MRRKKRWIFLLMVITVIGAGMALSRYSPPIAPGSYLTAHLGGSLTDMPESPLSQELLGGGQPNLTDLILQLRKAALDLRLQGVVLRISPLNVSFAQLQDLRDALAYLRKAGKEVIAWVIGESGSGIGEYYLASAADRVYVAENALLPLLGLRANYLFLGGVWDKLDIDMQVEKVREYKTFRRFPGGPGDDRGAPRNGEFAARQPESANLGRHCRGAGLDAAGRATAHRRPDDDPGGFSAGRPH